MVNSVTVKAPKRLVEGNLEFSDASREIQQITVTRARCVDPTLLDSFLRMLRHESDDVIRQRLNEYLKLKSRFKSTNESCDTFLKTELYPSWQARNQIISFCDAESHVMKKEIDSKEGSSSYSGTAAVVDARLDPYAARNRLEEQKSKYRDWEAVTSWVRNNREIEFILQGNSDGILKQQCDQNINYINKFWDFLARINK